jgi:hypothetical protein
MTDERLIMAIGRLERAVTRVEAAAGAADAQRAELAALRKRHDRLRGKAQEAIDAIDRLTQSA